MPVTRQHPTRRSVLKSAALGSVAVITAPYVKNAYAAGTVRIGAWDHWIPDANGALTSLCSEWGAKNNVEVKIDYITSQGDKLPITAAAEAQAGPSTSCITRSGTLASMPRSSSRSTRSWRAYPQVRSDQSGV